MDFDKKEITRQASEELLEEAKREAIETEKERIRTKRNHIFPHRVIIVQKGDIVTIKRGDETIRRRI